MVDVCSGHTVRSDCLEIHIAYLVSWAYFYSQLIVVNLKAQSGCDMSLRIAATYQDTVCRGIPAPFYHIGIDCPPGIATIALDSTYTYTYGQLQTLGFQVDVMTS